MEKYLGPFRPLLESAATAVSRALQSCGFKSPPQPVLVQSLIFSTLMVLLVSSLILPLLWRKRDLRDAVLLIGTSADRDTPAVGKTTLFHVLRYGLPPKKGTVPSMVVNDAVFAPTGSPNEYRWLDFPGHPRLRHLLPPYLKVSKCIVFVVDGVSFSAHARKDAELLYDILTSPAVVSHGTPILVFCNKADVGNITKTSVIKTRLEAELERAKAARMSTLRSAGVSANANEEHEEEIAFLGYENEPFTFEHAPGPVTFATGSALSKDIESVLHFAKNSFL